MTSLLGADEDGGPGLDDSLQPTTAELLDGDLAWAGHLNRPGGMSQQTVVIEGGAVGEAVGLAGEEGADSERDVLRSGPSAEQPELADRIVPGRDPVHQPRSAPAGEQVGGCLRGESQTFADIARSQTRLSSCELVIEEAKRTIWYFKLEDTRFT